MANVVVVDYKETKEALSLVFAFMKAYEASRANGEWDAGDIMQFFPVVLLIGPAFKDIDNAAIELRTSTPEQAEELKAWIKENVDLTDDQIEKFIEDAFAAIVTVWTVINTYVLKAIGQAPLDLGASTEGDTSTTESEA